MTIFYAFLLGILQGLTEFLPISSTAHLTLAGKIFGIVDSAPPEDWTAFMAIIQLGTVAAVMLYFRTDIAAMCTSLLKDLRARPASGTPRWNFSSRLAFMVIVGTIPVAVIGLLFKHAIEGTFTKELSTIGTSLIVLALILLAAERIGKRVRSIESANWRDAVIIGFAQACALIPGSSRSGTTITAGLFLGLTREAAARFSFLLSIPAVIASGLFELYEARHHLTDMGIAPIVVATMVSGVVGYATIAFLLGYLKTHTTKIFIGYRLLLGAAIWALLLMKAL